MFNVRVSLVSLALLVSFVTAQSTVDTNTAAKAAGKLYFGSATDNSELTDSAYVQTLSNNKLFGQITAANSMKWDATEPSRGTFTFTNADRIANLAKANSQLLRGDDLARFPPTFYLSEDRSQLRLA
ncbi:hypothetical protein E1B28_011074 [Marasmius oreades]|uniref:endo-1,4-beta-xylanase n=1 Tax=Marasmius oreades TaxID=181124 RepID=A0A9P7RTD3_9AGAR|nr:uncharacterized protein E1B28_011074 [Marasmius oreades]KAG7089384.1 hypothetical protein E1B28_011074 [Marasmius oreades]